MEDEDEDDEELIIDDAISTCAKTTLEWDLLPHLIKEAARWI